MTKKMTMRCGDEFVEFRCCLNYYDQLALFRRFFAYQRYDVIIQLLNIGQKCMSTQALYPVTLDPDEADVKFFTQGDDDNVNCALNNNTEK